MSDITAIRAGSPSDDIAHAREQLQTHGWIARHSEAFHHLPPPALEQWLGTQPQPATDGSDWQVHVQAGADYVQVQQLSALDATERQALLADLPAPEGDAAPFAWAQRAVCRQGLRVQVAASADGQPVRLHVQHLAQLAVDAPLLVLDLAPGARCLLLHTAQRAASLAQARITQNLHMHIRLGAGAQLQHLRIADVQTDDQLAHVQRVEVAENAQYHQALCTSGCAYQLQRSDVQLQGPGARVRHAGLLLNGNQRQVDQQVSVRHNAPDTDSHVQVLALGSGKSRTVGNSFAYIAPGAREANVHQRLWGIALDGQPRMTLRPHLEILHDQVQATHGATWGALPADALFYAQQRGLDAATARGLIIEGMARALLERALPALPAQGEDAGEGNAEASGISALLEDWLQGPSLSQAIEAIAHSALSAQEPVQENA